MEALLAILPLSLSSGINLYLTLFGIGLATRLGYIDTLPGLGALSTTPVLIVTGVLFLLEFFADKIPYVDSVWDFFHTFVRPMGALVLALNLVPEGDPGLAMAAALIAGTTALTAHSGKAGLRALVNTSPEPVTNSAVSIAEDLSVIGLLVLAVQYPMLAALVALLLLVAIILGLVLLIRWARARFTSLRDFFFRRNPTRKVKTPA